MRIRFASLLCGVALVAGCEVKSKLEPGDNVTLSGTLRHQDQSVAPGLKVSLTKNPTLGQALGTLVFFPLDLLKCLEPNATEAICGNARLQTTDASGSFEFLMEGSDTQTTFGHANPFVLVTQEPPKSGELSGASITAGFYIQEIEVPVPDFTFWEPQLALQPVSGTLATVAVQGALPHGSGTVAQQYTVSDRSGQAAISGAVGAPPFDLRYFEDHDGSLLATASRNEESSGTSWTLNYTSDAVPFHATAGAPPSRGAACYGQKDNAAAQLSPCLLTDGDFTSSPAPFDAPACVGADGGTITCNPTPNNNWLEVDLGAARSISWIVVRGYSSGDVVESSVDGSSWSAAPLDQGSYGNAFVPASGTQARYVRVRASDAAGQVLGITEISVW